MSNCGKMSFASMGRPIWLLLAAFACVSAAALPVSAATNVSITVSPESGSSTDSFILTVSVTGDEPENVSAPQFRDSEYFSLTNQGTSQKTTIINGRKQSEISHTFELSAKRSLAAGRYPVPMGYVTSGTQQVWLKRPEINIIGDAGGGRPVVGGIDFSQTIDKLNPYVGEQVVYRVDVAVHRRVLAAELSAVAFEGFMQEPFGKGREVTKVVGNQETKMFSQKDALFPTAPGPHNIAPRSLSVKLQIRNEAAAPPRQDLFDEIWGGFFDLNSYSTVVKKLFTKPLAILVRPLPEPPKPGLGFIPVGTVSLRADIDRTALKEGESATLRLTLDGNANLRPLELPPPVGPDLANFRFYPEKPKLDVKPEQDFVRFTKEFNIAVVPQKPGALRVPSYEVTTFDPQTSTYRVLRSPEFELNIEPDPQGKALVVSGVAPPSRTDRPAKEISILAEDLLPQHIGESTLSSRPAWPPRLIMLFILGAPALAAWTLSTYRRRLQLAGNPRLTARQHALRNAFDKLDRASSLEPRQAVTEIELALRSFLGDRYGVLGAALTSEEAVDLARARIQDKASAEELAENLIGLERKRYGGAQPADAEFLPQLIQKLKELLSRIDKERR